jgi:hypothetical protein
VGIFHGTGELLQGSAIVESNNAIALPENWPNAEFYTKTNGSPVFSILTGIPFYVLGILAISVSCLLIFHSRFRMDKKNGLLIFALLNVGIFLFGAGQGTPIAMGIPLVVFGIISIRFQRKRERSETSKKFILGAFNLFYFLQIFSWLLFFPGLVIVSSYGKIPEPLFLFDFMLMPISILGALIFALLHDNTVHHQNEVNHV